MRSTANKSTTPRMIPSWQSRNFAWSGCNRDVREAFLCIGFEESGRPIWHLFQTDFTEIMLLFWDVFLLFHTFPRLYNAGQMFFGGASSKKNHSWRLKREFYGTQCQQAMFSSIQKHFLRCKMLVGECPKPLWSAFFNAGCASRRDTFYPMIRSGSLRTCIRCDAASAREAYFICLLQVTSTSIPSRFFKESITGLWVEAQLSRWSLKAIWVKYQFYYRIKRLF